MAIQNRKQLTLAGYFLQGTLDPDHRLVVLAGRIDWDAVLEALRPYYSTRGRGALSIRLMVGLHLLKHLENMSDAQVSDRIRSDLYWMHFCGVDLDSLKGKFSHLNSSSMTKFRNRIGAQGFAEVERVIQIYFYETKKVDPRIMTTDSSCMPKAIEYPTDSALLNKGRQNLLKGIQRLRGLGVKSVRGIRTFSRRARQIAVAINKLGKDRMERIQAGTMELAKQAVHVKNKAQEMLRRASRKTDRATKKAAMMLRRQIKIVDRVIQQSRLRFQGEHVPRKIYSLHEPQVCVIRKGKRAFANEYGSKFNLSIDKNGIIVSHEILWTNKNDTQLLKPAIQNWRESTGVYPRQVNADRGYSQKAKGSLKKISRLCIPSHGKTPHPDSKKPWFKKGQSLRAGIEAVIGHLKQDHRLDRSRYKGTQGDQINLSLGCLAWNLKKMAT